MIKNELGEFLRKIRMEVYDEGVKKFAKRLDIPAWTYRSIEEGRTVHPQKETIDKIEKALHIKISMMNFEELSTSIQHSYRKERYVARLAILKERIEAEIDNLARIPTDGKYEFDEDMYNQTIKELIRKLQAMTEIKKEESIDWMAEMEKDFYQKKESEE